MDESTARSLILSLHILSIVLVACTVAVGGALVGVSRAIERWMPTLALFAAARLENAERADQEPAVMPARGKQDDG